MRKALMVLGLVLIAWNAAPYGPTHRLSRDCVWKEARWAAFLRLRYWGSGAHARAALAGCYASRGAYSPVTLPGGTPLIYELLPSWPSSAQLSAFHNEALHGDPLRPQ